MSSIGDMSKRNAAMDLYIYILDQKAAKKLFSKCPFFRSSLKLHYITIIKETISNSMRNDWQLLTYVCWDVMQILNVVDPILWINGDNINRIDKCYCTWYKVFLIVHIFSKSKI